MSAVEHIEAREKLRGVFLGQESRKRFSLDSAGRWSGPFRSFGIEAVAPKMGDVIKV